MELDSRKNEARSDLKQQDIVIEVSIGAVDRPAKTFSV
jgi:hypothetical protein